ncbi:hypothetical protein J3454_15050, partial [Erythrobacter sp. NFXS35]|uniref:hypothetical protein n=1 Tax=Erythrobacter sp. NFXS35 TaxID=2818436 RepID=UPI0032DFC5AC
SDDQNFHQSRTLFSGLTLPQLGGKYNQCGTLAPILRAAAKGSFAERQLFAPAGFKADADSSAQKTT